MADQRQVKFKEVNIWFYIRWAGFDLGIDLRKAIKFAKHKWKENNVCLMMILCKLSEPQVEDSNGTGIWNESIDSCYTDY